MTRDMCYVICDSCITPVDNFPLHDYAQEFIMKPSSPFLCFKAPYGATGLVYQHMLNNSRKV